MQSLPSDKLNLSELARKYDVRLVDSESELKNGVQVVKELLRNKGIDVDGFGEKTERVRWKCKKGPGGEISIPTTSTIAELNNEIKKNGLKMEHTILASLLHQRNFQDYR